MATDDDTNTQATGDAAAAGTGTSGAAPGVDAPARSGAAGGNSPGDGFEEAFNDKPELFVGGAFAAGLGFAILLRALGGGSDD